MKNNCLSCLNNNCPFKKARFEEIINDKKSVYTLKKYQYVFKESFQFDGVYIIKEGKVKVVSLGYKDRVHTIRLTKNGDLLGYRTLGIHTFSNSAITLEDTELCFIDGEFFYSLLQKEIKITYNLMLLYAEDLRMAEIRMKKLSQMTVNEKVIDALLFAYAIYGKENPNGVKEINASISRNDIAEIAGVRADQLIKVVSYLKEIGAIYFDKNKHVCIKNFEYLNSQISLYL